MVQNHACNRTEMLRPRTPFAPFLLPDATVIAMQAQAQPTVHRGLVLDQDIDEDGIAGLVPGLEQEIRLRPPQCGIDKRARPVHQRGEIQWLDHVPGQARVQPGPRGVRISHDPAHQRIVFLSWSSLVRHAVPPMALAAIKSVPKCYMVRNA